MNKKGFTLVELISIIVILAIIALITTPIVTNVVETFRKNTFKESTNGLIRAAQLYYSEQVEETQFYGKTFDFSKDTSELSFNGKKPIAGTLVMDSDGLIKVNVTNGTYCASKDFESNEVVVTKTTDCTNTSLEPEITMSALSEGTKRIIVKAQCTEVGNTTIKKYEFKIGDKWVSNGKDYYIFDNLESNKEYIVSARCVNSIGIVAEKSLSVKTSLILAPTISITPETEYAQERIVKLNYPIDENGKKITGRFKYEYSVDEGETWKEFEDGFTLKYDSEEDNDKLVIARATDSKNEYSSNTIISGIDTTAPNCTIKVSDYTLEYVMINADCTDSVSGIKNYQYSVEDKEYETSIFNIHKFDGIKISTIKVKVTDNIENSKEYVLSETEKERVYEGLYNLLNKKYNDLNNNAFLYAYPVGSIYKTTADDENTASKMASKYGGTWEAYGTNRVLRGTTGIVDSTGGNSTVTLTTNNLPNHTHSFTPNGSFSSTFAGTTVTSEKNTVVPSATFSNGTTSSTSKTLTGTIQMHSYATCSNIHLVSGILSSNYVASYYCSPDTKITGAPSIGIINLDATHSHGVTGTPSLYNREHTHTHTASGTISNTFKGTAGTTESAGKDASSISTVNVLDSYITVYMYRRIE